MIIKNILDLKQHLISLWQWRETLVHICDFLNVDFVDKCHYAWWLRFIRTNVPTDRSLIYT